MTVSSAGGRVAMRGQGDPDFDVDVSPSSTLREGDGSPPDDEDNSEMDEERLQAQKEMQMLDLGTARREYVTTNDKSLPRELRVSKEQLLRERKVNEEGTDAAKWYQKNKKELNAWNNISTAIAGDHADREKLDDLMGGQSHRARLNRDIKERGGQEYGESSNAAIDDYPHRARGGGNIGRGMQGRSGRGAPMHAAAGRGNGSLLGVKQPSMTPTGPKANRPLDPALDPDREYGYKSKRGGKTFTMSYNSGVILPLSRGNTSNDARATMVGSTVRIVPAAPSRPKTERSERSEPARAPPLAPLTSALNEQAFLRVMNDMKTKPTFNDHVQEKSKPAPASKAAALVEQPAKATKKAATGTKKPVTGTKKPVSAISKSIETPAEAFQKLETRAADKSTKVEGSIRLAPTHEFAFPPPVTKFGEKNIQGSNVSVHTDGVETAATFDSADFATQSSVKTPFDLNPNPGTSTIASNSTKENLTAKDESQSRSNGLGIYVLPPAGYSAHEHEGDLITLDEGSEQPQTDTEPSNANVLAVSTGSGGPSPGVPDIMDEELDDDVQQTSLTPNSLIAPRSLEYRGARYIRADQITGQDLGKLLQEARPATQIKSSEVGSQENPSPAETNVPEIDESIRVTVTEGLNIGLRTLQESSGGSLLGEHNLPGRSRRPTEESSAQLLVTSEWATGNNKSARLDVTAGLNIGLQTLGESSGPSILGDHNLPGRSRGFTEVSSAMSLEDLERATGKVKSASSKTDRPKQPRYQTQFSPVALQQPWQQGRYFQSSEKEDTAMTNASAASSAPQKAAKSSSLISSKDATPEAIGTANASPVSSTPPRASNTSSLTSSKYATPEAIVMTSRVPAAESAILPGPAEFSIKGRANNNEHISSTAPQNHQDNQIPISRALNDTQRLHSSYSSKAGGEQDDGARKEVEERTTAATIPSHKVSSLGDSKWGDSETGFINSVLPKQNFRFDFPLSSTSENPGAGRNLSSAVESEIQEPRRTNPFGGGADLIKRRNDAPNNNLESPEIAAPVPAPMVAERAGNVQPTGRRPLNMQERIVQAMRSGPQAGPVKFGSGDSSSSKSSKPMEPKPATGSTLAGRTIQELSKANRQ